jgi:hypothetical protein
MMILKTRIASAAGPLMPSFWFVMSIGLLVGFITAYPMNWWLVTYHLKHGMMTVRPAAAAGARSNEAQADTNDSPRADADMHPAGGEIPRGRQRR